MNEKVKLVIAWNSSTATDFTFFCFQTVMKRVLKSLLYPTPKLSKQRLQKAYKGKVCIITGASSGIGYELARTLIEQGTSVCLIARRQAPLQKLCELASANGVTAEAIPLDLRSHEELDALCQHLRERYHRVDYLFCNAGKSIHRSIRDALTPPRGAKRRGAPLLTPLHHQWWR